MAFDFDERLLIFSNRGGIERQITRIRGWLRTGGERREGDSGKAEGYADGVGHGLEGGDGFFIILIT